VDGDFDVSDLERDYGVITLRVSDLPSEKMRKLIGGSFHAKQAAMWEGPFEFYVWLDSDAIIWGDFTAQVRRDVDFHIFWDSISIPANEATIPDWVAHYYFDVPKLLQFDPGFAWRGLAYFCAGVYACRRNAISFEEYTKIEMLNRQVPGLFAWGDMGMLTYLVHSLEQRGELKTAMSDLQHIWGHHGVAELAEDCRGAGWNFPKVIQRPRVEHFCGRKPFLFDRKAFSRPFTIARLEHHRRHHGNLGAWLAVLNEDRRVLAGKFKKRLRK
jgi:hypothetical protein